ncbi:MAG: tRNA1(Val) (adenine(37)-N6)-methyltransferase [Lachnospiraceae bacterium]|nr:tRNA1(Val) (adenine(37)-N6)-methyltransferase [Lachnospiraceae bacterium]
MDVIIKDNERLDDLQCKGYRIIQNPDMFCFGMDAVLLADFATGKKGGRVMDLGTGTGVIPILMEARNKAAHFTGLEIQNESADMALRSVMYNNLGDKIDIVCGDIKEVDTLFKRESFDAVVSNPPYISGSHGLENPSEPKNIARHEILLTLEDVVKAAAYLLKVGGSFAMVHKPFRLAEIIRLLSSYRLEPKRMLLVQPYEDKEPNMVLIEAFKGGNSMIKIEPTLVVYNRDGSYTDELLLRYDGYDKQ